MNYHLLILWIFLILILDKGICLDKMQRDDNSESNTLNATLKHMSLIWKLNLLTKKIDCEANLKLKTPITSYVNLLFLDVWNLQDITKLGCYYMDEI